MILGVILLLNGTPLTEQALDGTQPASIHVHLIIDYQDFAPSEEYSLVLPPGNQTVYNAMVLAKLDMETTGSGSLLFVEAINDIRNNQDGNYHWWQFWVDGELAPVGAGSYVLHDDAVVEWRYTHPQML